MGIVTTNDRTNLARKTFVEASLDHHAYEVRAGMMASAVYFFTHIVGWSEIATRASSGDWGKARFVSSVYHEFIQLTELTQGADPRRITGNHLGILVLDAQKAALAVQDWAALVNTECAIEQAGLNWTVHLPQLFAFSIELLPPESVVEEL